MPEPKPVDASKPVDSPALTGDQTGPVGKRSRSGAAAPTRPFAVTIAVIVAVIEAVGVLAFTVSFVIGVFPVGDPVATELAMALGVIVFLLVVVAGLLAAARSLAQLRHWPRSLLVVLQVIALALGIPLARDGFLVGWLMAVPAAIMVVALLLPATTAAIDA